MDFNLHPCRRKAAFTLAEVLITLGIIGVVAAMTLPTLVDSYYKQVAEARLKKFYSVYNQAILLSEVKNGPKESWYQEVSGVEFDDEGNAITETNEIDKWFSKYLGDFMVIKKKTDNLGAMVYYLADGSQFRLTTGLEGREFAAQRDVAFYPFGNYEQCQARSDRYGRCRFDFNFYPISNSEQWKYLYQKGLEPYMAAWDGNNSSLFASSGYGCGNGGEGQYCTAIIARNGWKVPKNYPRKIHP